MFPGTASIYNDDGGIIESRIRIRTEGMRKVMIDKTKAWATARKISRKLLGSAPLVPHAEEMHRGSDQVNVGEGHLATSHAFQVVAKTGPCRLPSKTDFVELFRTDPGKFENACMAFRGKRPSCFTRLRRSSERQKVAPHHGQCKRTNHVSAYS